MLALSLSTRGETTRGGGETTRGETLLGRNVQGANGIWGETTRIPSQNFQYSQGWVRWSRNIFNHGLMTNDSLMVKNIAENIQNKDFNGKW